MVKQFFKTLKSLFFRSTPVSKVTVVIAVSLIALPVGSTYANTTVTLTDGAGAIQTASVNGSETPAWTVEFDDVDLTTAAGSVSVQAEDSTGAGIGAPLSQSIAMVGTGGGGTPPATFPSPTGITVTVA